MNTIRKYWSLILIGLCLFALERAQYNYIKSQVDKKIDSGDAIEPILNGGGSYGTRASE